MYVLHFCHMTPKDYLRSLPFLLVHLTPLALFWTGISWWSVLLCVGLYVMRMFFVTAGYHRYFAHRTYTLGRFSQFFMALGGTLALQKGPLWWAAHHRDHHKYSDTELDIHSPKRGFWWSHMGWIISDEFKKTDYARIHDMAKYPELRVLNKYWIVPPIGLAILCLWLAGPQGLFVGFFLSTILVWHVTFSINSIAHKIGSRRYATTDTSRNFLPLAILTLGEGWHNNHHHFHASAKQGFFWWEIDVSYYTLKVMSWIGVVKKLRVPPKPALKLNRIKDGVLDIGMFEEHWQRAASVMERTKKNTEEMYKEKTEALREAMEHAKAQAEQAVRVSRGPVKKM